MKAKTFLSRLAVIGLAGLTLAACGASESREGSKTINVVSREEGSGTRGAFVELFSIEEKGANGSKVDLTTPNAMITNSTAVMLTTVAGDAQAIGYVSMGSLGDKAKVLEIDGTAASVDNVKNGSYKISRAFNIVTKSLDNKAAQDFINYILSNDGQIVVEDAGYISVDKDETYKATVDSGKVVVSGSSSVTPVMEKLKEAYLKVNPKVTIEIQQSDSSTGITNTIDGTTDIGMASRELKDAEISAGLIAQPIALDGIAVIVNEENTVKSLTSEQVKGIFSGDVTNWDEVGSK